jgi:hypothetical protein
VGFQGASVGLSFDFASHEVLMRLEDCPKVMVNGHMAGS